MDKQLSQLQKAILVKTQKAGRISIADILIDRYQFEPVSSGKIRFDRHRIGLKKYLSATAAVSRSMTRLISRGLLFRAQGFFGLTPQGRSVVRMLNG